MRQQYLTEDELPPKLSVSFSAEIRKKINAIYAYNQKSIDNTINEMSILRFRQSPIGLSKK